MKVAVITGASSGMGRDFARQIADRRMADELWLIARRENKLDELRKEIESVTGDISVRCISLDLASEQGIESYRNLLAELKPEISVLVNAAGFGRFALSTEVPLRDSLSMVDLNDKALLSMCFLSIDYMHEGAHIINMGSLSSFQPVPYINVYGASKAFVLSFSRALNVELKPRGINVICVCPGWVKTEFFDHAVSDNGAVTYYNKYWTSEQVVTKAMKDLHKGKDVSILGFGVRAQVLATKLLPHKLVMKIWMKQQKHS